METSCSAMGAVNPGIAATHATAAAATLLSYLAPGGLPVMDGPLAAGGCRLVYGWRRAFASP